MSDLPVCRLCKCDAELNTYFKLLKVYRCSYTGCSIHKAALPESDWRKLMHVPAKKTGYIEHESDLDINWAIGYNQAIDDLERGEA